MFPQFPRNSLNHGRNCFLVHVSTSPPSHYTLLILILGIATQTTSIPKASEPTPVARSLEQTSSPPPVAYNPPSTSIQPMTSSQESKNSSTTNGAVRRMSSTSDDFVLVFSGDISGMAREAPTGNEVRDRCRDLITKALKKGFENRECDDVLWVSVVMCCV